MHSDSRTHTACVCIAASVCQPTVALPPSHSAAAAAAAAAAPQIRFSRPRVGHAEETAGKGGACGKPAPSCTPYLSTALGVRKNPSK
eukprot:366458-Chlamydomonas_euryale.AAC.35